MGEATIHKYTEPNPKVPLGSFPSDSEGPVLGVAKPAAGQHRGSLECRINEFARDGALLDSAPCSRVRYLKYK